MLLNPTLTIAGATARDCPTQEIAAYEAIWTRYTTAIRISTLFRRFQHRRPSDVAQELGISVQELGSMRFVIEALLPFDQFAALFYGDRSYPTGLYDAKHPPELLYYQGRLDRLCSKSVAVVGTGHATEAGRRRARKLARLLVAQDITVMSGLAQGIDTAAHQAALDAGGRTVAVIGTPLSVAYPRENLPLQRQIAQNHLLISQVPFYLYSRQDYRKNRYFFPERNKVMAALSQATVIVEASERSGALIQAEAALQQGRKLFILNSCFEQGWQWCDRLVARGAIRVVDGSEIAEHLG
jgi:DNA processing protein